MKAAPKRNRKSRKEPQTTHRRCRLRAVLSFRGSNERQFALLVGCSPVHLRGILLGERPANDRIAEAIRVALGDDWDFVVERTNQLGPPPAETEAAQ